MIFLRYFTTFLLLPGIQSIAADAAPDGRPWMAAAISRTPMTGATGGAELETEETLIGAGMRLVDRDSVRVDVGVDYQYTRYEYVDIDSRDRDLHRLQLPLHAEADIGDWQWSGYVAPGVSTSSNVMKDLFSEAGRDDFLVTGRALLTREIRNRRWFAGIAHDRRFGRSRAYPVAGVEFAPATDVHVRLAFPDPAVLVRISANQSVEARVFPAGHQWHVVSDDFTSEFDYRVEAWRGQVTWRLPVWRLLGLDLSAGYEVGRAHFLTGDDGTRTELAVDDQWFFTVGLRLGNAPVRYTHGADL
jgi:hypothetical protein